jgi:Arc/MetJ-type ribon-helix-helix transcriptional regulator
MIGEIHRLRDKSGETEKITINIGFVDLGHIDLLVHEGFYSNRSDFIRTAIRNQLATHADTVKQSIVRHTLELGLRRYSREDLEAVKEAGGKLCIQVVDNRRRRDARTRTCNNRVNYRPWRSSGQQSS